MKIKLPRKRKKRFIKAKSRYDYHMCCIANEVLFEEIPWRSRTKFPEFLNVPGKRLKVLFNY
jgi:hypothetical protein